MKNGTGMGNISDGVYLNVMDRHECNINFECIHISCRNVKYLTEIWHCYQCIMVCEAFVPMIYNVGFLKKIDTHTNASWVVRIWYQ